jgi:hypothetical protein
LDGTTRAREIRAFPCREASGTRTILQLIYSEAVATAVAQCNLLKCSTSCASRHRAPSEALVGVAVGGWSRRSREAGSGWGLLVSDLWGIIWSA